MSVFLFPEEVKAYLDNVAKGKMQIASYNIKKDAHLDKCFVNLSFANAPAAFPAEVQDYLDNISAGNLKVSDYDITRDIQKGEGRMMLVLSTPVSRMPMIEAFGVDHQIEYPKSLVGDRDYDVMSGSSLPPPQSERRENPEAEPKDPVSRIKEAIEDLKENKSSESEDIIAWLLQQLKRRDSRIESNQNLDIEEESEGVVASDSEDVKEIVVEPEAKEDDAAPEVAAPEVVVPEVVAPEVAAPEVTAPEVAAQEMAMPVEIKEEEVKPEVVAMVAVTTEESDHPASVIVAESAAVVEEDSVCTILPDTVAKVADDPVPVSITDGSASVIASDTIIAVADEPGSVVVEETESEAINEAVEEVLTEPIDTDTPPIVTEKQENAAKIDTEQAISSVEDDFKFLSEEGSNEEGVVVVEESKVDLTVQEISANTSPFTPTFQDDVAVVKDEVNNNKDSDLVDTESPTEKTEAEAKVKAPKKTEKGKKGTSEKLKKGSKGKKSKKDAGTTMGIEVEKSEEEDGAAEAAVPEAKEDVDVTAASTPGFYSGQLWANEKDAVVQEVKEDVEVTTSSTTTSEEDAAAKEAKEDVDIAAASTNANVEDAATMSPEIDAEVSTAAAEDAAKRATIAVSKDVAAKGGIMKKKDKKEKKEKKKEKDGSKSIVKFRLFGGFFGGKKKAKNSDEPISDEAKAMTLPIRFNDVHDESSLLASASENATAPTEEAAAEEATVDAGGSEEEKKTAEAEAEAEAPSETNAESVLISPEVPFRLQKEKDNPVAADENDGP